MRVPIYRVTNDDDPLDYEYPRAVAHDDLEDDGMIGLSTRPPGRLRGSQGSLLGTIRPREGGGRVSRDLKLQIRLSRPLLAAVERLAASADMTVQGYLRSLVKLAVAGGVTIPSDAAGKEASRS